MTSTPFVAVVLVGLSFAVNASGQAPPSGAPAPSQARSVAERVSQLRKIDGFFPLYWDDGAGRLLMEIARFDTEVLYQVSLPAGVGSNPIGLDRGQLGSTHVIVFERVGPRVLMVERNYRFRALSDDAAERRAVEDSFARSVHWGFKVEAAEGGRVLVDATAFFLRDAHGVADRLRQRQQGRYRVDDSRSAIFLSRTKGFPKNTEIEATITLVTDEDPGPLVREVVPAPQAVTVRQHHSLVELPPLGEDGYRPRKADPRVNAMDITFNDYASPITEPVDRHWAIRHHLVKTDPSAAASEVVEPIVYYVDNGAPEPIRSALVDGASWWGKAFEAAGFRNAFLVKVLPADADRMDLRYNMITWVHRSTRGWSYGSSVVDPRTGRILKGNVSLGSLRVRQDHLIGTGLVRVASAPSGHAAALGDGGFACDLGDAPGTEYLAALDPSTDAVAMSLARIRQLSAHEVGHTLGFEHNFAASTFGRASVMDYPAPDVALVNGRVDLSHAYASGIGEYDVFAVRVLYSQFAPGDDEEAALNRMIEDGLARGMVFVADNDARPAGAAHPLGHLWDNGADAVAGLRHAMEVRRVGLSHFGLANIPVGAPLSMLEVTLVPLYLHHRFQLQAAAKLLGGASFTYAVKTSAGPSPSLVQELVPPERQREALAAVLDALAPSALALPPELLALIPPRAPAFGGTNTEFLPGHTAPIFDHASAATVAADLVVSALLQPQRLARLADFHARDSRNPSPAEVLDALLGRTWLAAPPKDGGQALVHRAVQTLAATRLMDLAADPAASPAVRHEANAALRRLRAGLTARTAGVGTSDAHRRGTIEEIDRFLARPDAPHRRTPPPPIPAGEPIG